MEGRLKKVPLYIVNLRDVIFKRLCYTSRRQAGRGDAQNTDII